MTVYIHAANVHQGGGRTLLNELLKAATPDFFFTLDARMAVPVGSVVHHVKFVKPTLIERIKTEFFLRTQVKPQDALLCFGNLPPMLRSRGKVTVFLQNRYLFGPQNYKGFSVATVLRLSVERWWFRTRMRSAYRIVVQSQTMQRELKCHLGFDAEVMPFVPALGCSLPNQQSSETGTRFDFVYVSSAEPHKNHHNLVEAWKLLAVQGVRPSLALTVNPDTSPTMVGLIQKARQDHALKIENLGTLPHGQVAALYAQSKALIFPSRLESFGLPLLEAKQLGMPVLAPELDYVRDVVEPDQTFNPESPTSIARAVLRHLNIQSSGVVPLDAASFLTRIQQQAQA